MTLGKALLIGGLQIMVPCGRATWNICASCQGGQAGISIRAQALTNGVTVAS